MEAIIFQGREIKVRSINRIDGSDKKLDGIHVWADELLRDADGNYYAVRERHVRSSWTNNARITKTTETIRRISPSAAILWAVNLTGYEGSALRRDAAALLSLEREENIQSVLDHLDPEIGLRVLRFLCLNPWAYTSADVVNGCVAYALKQAFNALKDMRGIVPDVANFVDNGWGYVEEAICDAALRRNGGRTVRQKDAPKPTSNRRSRRRAEVEGVALLGAASPAAKAQKGGK